MPQGPHLHCFMPTAEFREMLHMHSHLKLTEQAIYTPAWHRSTAV